MARYLYSELAGLITARANCGKRLNAAQIQNPEWFDKHTETIQYLVRECLPSGSGIDSGTKINLDASRTDKLVFYCSFHHMNENGFYDGWTDHTITVTPSLQHKFYLRISGRDRNDVKEYLQEMYEYALSEDVTYKVFVRQFPELAVTSKWEDEQGNPSQCYQAWYSSGVRFWNDLNGAMEHAGKLMENKFYRR